MTYQYACQAKQTSCIQFLTYWCWFLETRLSFYDSYGYTDHEGTFGLRPCLSIKEPTFFVHTVLRGIVNLPLYLLKNMNWDPRSVKRGIMYRWRIGQCHWPWVGSPFLAGMVLSPVPERAAASPLGTQCFVVSWLSMRASRGASRVALASRWERLLLLPWCWSSADYLLQHSSLQRWSYPTALWLASLSLVILLSDVTLFIFTL